MVKDESLEQILAACFASTKVCSKQLFPDRFWLPWSKLHDEIFRILDDDSIQQAAIAAPRGFGKTTIDTIAYPAKKILFREKKFIVPVSCSATNAVMQGENLKRELMTNRTVRELFGPMKSHQFSKEQWITNSGTMVMPRGAGQQIRGILYDRWRPDLIIIDDLEDPEAVRNDELRKQLREWFFSDVCNSINRARNDWKIVVVGTILHEDSLLVHLLEDPDWHSVQLSICDDNLRSSWPDQMSDADVRKLYEAHKRRGQLDLFYREYRNIPVSTEDATFRPEYFRYYNHADGSDKTGPAAETEATLTSNPRLENVVLVDPAKTVKMHSAESAIVGVGLDMRNHALFVRDIVAERLYPDELYNETFGMAARLGAKVVGIEVTSLHEFITQPFRNEMYKRGQFFELVELHARGGTHPDKKSERIKSLVPFYRQGYIYHNPAVCGQLEAQLVAFPRSRRVDIMDALAYVVQMLELGARFFEPTLEDDEDEFAELERSYEEPLGDWRVA